MNCKKNSLLLLILCGVTVLSAQRIAVEASLYNGTVYRHTTKLTTQTGERIGGQELGFRIQTTGRRDWQAWRHYPALGIAFSHFRLGAGNHGDAFGGLPFLSLPVFRFGDWSAHFRVGTGMAWITRPYNWFSNPTQNAIGSHWNNISQFRLGVEYRATPRLHFNAGGSMTHLSNGGATLPNHGINIFSGWTGAYWQFHPLKNGDYKAAQNSKHSMQRRFGAQLQGGIALMEIASFDGPKHPVWIFSTAGYFMISQTNHVLIGLDYESNGAIYSWGLHSARFPDESSARQGSTRVAVTAAEEFLFGDISILLQFGKYLGNGINQFTPNPVYAKVSARYYLPTIFHKELRPFAGVSIKAHKFTAEFISWNLGLTL